MKHLRMGRGLKCGTPARKQTHTHSRPAVYPSNRSGVIFSANTSRNMVSATNPYLMFRVYVGEKLVLFLPYLEFCEVG